MPQYDFYVRCKECGTVHPMGVGIHLYDGPVDTQSIGETFKGQSLPPQILAIEGRKTLCLKSGKLFIQDDINQIFLVPALPAPQRRAKSEAP
ncbi:MAG TPA: hypothetical protein VFU31_31625 [Candidatus Binatia bacterium]|nr:hypothetical protein [Candidatus Binatia bacterium]